MAAYLEQTHGASARRACRVVGLHRSTKRQQPGRSEQGALGARLHALSERYPRFGYRKIVALLQGERWAVRRETVRRLRKREGLQVVQRARKRRPRGKNTTVPTRAMSPNHVWSDDLVHDATTDGRRLKCLTVLDEYTREGLTIHCARSITASDVVNESFNGVFRDGCLNRWLFAAVQEARRLIHHWREEYNDERPHGALDGLTSHAFAAQCSCQSVERAA